jgi:hypothetical protein
VETEHVHFAVDALCDGHDGLIDCAAGERELSLEATEEFKRHGVVNV